MEDYAINPEIRRQGEEMFVEMLSTYVQLGKIPEAKKYLEKVRSTFSGYEEWTKILDTPQDLTKLVLED